MKRIALFVIFAAVLAVFVFTACEKAQTKNMHTTNDSDGWTCEFEMLNESFTNTFPINGSKLRVTSHINTGTLNIIIKGNGVTETIDGSSYEGSIPMDKFGEGSVYITLQGSEASGGKVNIIWEK